MANSSCQITEPCLGLTCQLQLKVLKAGGLSGAGRVAAVSPCYTRPRCSMFPPGGSCRVTSIERVMMRKAGRSTTLAGHECSEKHEAWGTVSDADCRRWHSGLRISLLHRPGTLSGKIAVHDERRTCNGGLVWRRPSVLVFHGMKHNGTQLRIPRYCSLRVAPHLATTTTRRGQAMVSKINWRCSDVETNDIFAT
jgi:hypothetical protein